MKFLSKIMIENLKISDSELFCSKLIHNIKEYYDLDEIIIINSLNDCNFTLDQVIRVRVIETIKDNYKMLRKLLNENNMVKLELKHKNDKYNLFISPMILSEDLGENDSLIVCLEKAPSLLTTSEVFSLNNSINLLKTRMLYF